ncbi:nucleotidyltransferase family protein [Candidatus Amarolinea aalborgensis]|uniref:nucleotidyltransferase family protein n=1 Tax=Candidatus Amarolinea aalborgensis TaxID=2249329 RepID=UPI003BF9B6D6
MARPIENIPKRLSQVADEEQAFIEEKLLMPTTEPIAALPQVAPHIAQIIRDFVRETKHAFREQVIAEYLFGSYSTDTQTPESDIDILIIVKEYSPELQWQLSGLASDYALAYGVCISPILKDIEVWQKNQHYQTLFYQNILRYGIPL